MQFRSAPNLAADQEKEQEREEEEEEHSTPNFLFDSTVSSIHTTPPRPLHHASVPVPVPPLPFRIPLPIRSERTLPFPRTVAVFHSRIDSVLASIIISKPNLILIRIPIPIRCPDIRCRMLDL